MTPERAVETLKELGYVLAETSKRGGQKWELPGGGHSIYIPSPTGIQKVPQNYIDSARRHALMASIADVVVLTVEPK
jgi:hypothetical protein